MFLSDLLGYVAVIVALGSGFYTLDRIRRGLHKPHVMSVVIWIILTTSAFINMLQQDIDAAAYRTGVMVLLMLCNFYLTTRHGFGYITRIDWVFFTLALFTIPIWVFTKNADIALYWLVFIEIAGTAPTFRKAWDLPWDLNPVLYIWVSIAQSLQLASLLTSGKDYSFALLLYMTLFPAMFAALTGILVYRRRKLSRA